MYVLTIVDDQILQMQVYKHFGIDKFYDATYFDMSPDNIENLGLKDKEFFKESTDYLAL